MDFEAAIIGAGPGGLVTALYLRRFLRKTILVGAGTPRAAWIPKTHNLLGFQHGLSGAALLKKLHNQIDDLGIERAVGEFEVKRIRGGYRVLSRDQEFTAKKVVLATGVTDVQPEINNVSLLRRLGLLRYCSVCDAYESKDKKLAVLTDSEHGLKVAASLIRFTEQVEVIWIGSQSKYPSHLARKFAHTHDLPIHPAAAFSIEEKLGKRQGLIFNVSSTPEKKPDSKTARKSFDACYVELGTRVNDFAFRKLEKLKRNKAGYLLTNSHQEVAMPDLFAIGDCTEGLSQIVVAASQAAIAATRLNQDLMAEK